MVVKSILKNYSRVSQYLIVKNVEEKMEFVKYVFGGKERKKNENS